MQDKELKQAAALVRLNNLATWMIVICGLGLFASLSSSLVLGIALIFIGD